MEAAKITKEMVESYESVGFSHEDAMDLMKTTIIATTKNTKEDD